MTTHSWKISWTEEPGRLQTMGLQRVRDDIYNFIYVYIYIYIYIYLIDGLGCEAIAICVCVLAIYKV